MEIVLNQDIVNFEGMALKMDNGQPLKMKTVLLGYISACKKMARPLSPEEKRAAYDLGRRIGTQSTIIDLNEAELNLMRKIAQADPMDDVFFILQQVLIILEVK
jgi:hypothetical protein